MPRAPSASLLEERDQNQIAVDARRVQFLTRFAPPQSPFPVGHLLAGLADAFAKRRYLRQVLADPHDLEAGLKLRRVSLPVKRFDLPPRQADQRVAMTERVVQEGEWVILRQGDEPQRQLGEIHGHGVAVHTVAAPLSNLAAGVDNLVLVGRNLRHRIVRPPRFDQRVGELPACFDRERAGTHRRVAYLQVEDPFGPERAVLLVSGPPLPDQRRGLVNP